MDERTTTPGGPVEGRPSPPEGAGIDLDPSRRPGVPKERRPEPWPHSRFPPTRQARPPSVPRHGRPGKPMPPVYGTAVPLRGISGLVRKAAYRHPDHHMRHWTMLLFADRVDAWGHRGFKLARVAVPAAIAVFVMARWMGRR